ncbi:MAG: YeeE/YedE thiosulfate transporter family protein [Anaerolineae bacterium]
MTNDTRRRPMELVWGLLFGILFGVLLHKGGITNYDVILGQLLLKDNTVLKIMLSAMVTGMLGIHLMKRLGWVETQVKPGSLGINVIGGLIFGVGFAVLGYCPGTLSGAIGSGHLDALVAGLPGILLGSALYAEIYPRVRGGIQRWGDYGDLTVPRWLRANEWVVIFSLAILVELVLFWMEIKGP